MNNPEDISQLINEIHELAGLLHFCMSPAPYPPALADNIRRRTADIAARCQAVAAGLPQDQESTPPPTPYYELEVGRTICNRPEVGRTICNRTDPTEPNTYRITLNDRYLFARELFSGDLRLLDQTIRSLAGADSEIIEAFFAKKSYWDPKNPTVKRFRQALSSYK
ncbi:MAG: hypothetical protein NC036_06985 [Muribaculaceae bacterium]|nr:hypothetical protein [Muribaculaceae bacterium]